MASEFRTSSDLPAFLFSSWHYRQEDIRDARRRDELAGWTVSSLCESYLKYQLAHYQKIHQDQAETNARPLSFVSIIVKKILGLLRKSISLTQDICRIAETDLLFRIVQDPQTSYFLLRKILTHPWNLDPRRSSLNHTRVIDIDEAILASERYARLQLPERRSVDFLTNLDDLRDLYTFHKKESIITIPRSCPPKGGFNFFDAKQKQEIAIHGTDDSFRTALHRVTHNVLEGLDWNNVFLAGGMVLHTLQHLDPSSDTDGDVANCDMDIYLYGLTPSEANDKIKHIHDVWARNMASLHSTTIVVKNPKTISLIPEYPHRRIQIVFKLLPTPTDILLNFDLDACAIGFDGSKIFMLPRCARALETGYSVFTMDLIWGHHLSDRRATQEFRIVKYADRGFGLRILPSYAKALEERHSLEEVDIDTETAGPWRRTSETKRFYPKEPGLKTLKRIAFLGQDFVHRYCFGVSDMVCHSTSQLELSMDKDELLNAIKEAEQSNNIPCIGPAELDPRIRRKGLPDGKNGLGGFELLMRHHEAWLLDALQKVVLNREIPMEGAYDDGSYNDMLTYRWDRSFSPNELSEDIDEHNDALFWILRKAVAEKLRISPFRGSYQNYLTRRIRRQVYGRSLDEVQAKQITIPIIIPATLQTYIANRLHSANGDVPTDLLSSLLIPAHDHAKYDPTVRGIPNLHDTVGEDGNIRYWVISNESIWAGQHRVLDEVYELLWALFYWFLRGFMEDTDQPLFTTLSTDNPDCVWHLAKAFRRRIVLRQVDPYQIKSGHTVSLREELLFRAWALHIPGHGRPRILHENEDEDDDFPWPAHKLFVEHAVVDEVPEHLFWSEKDEAEDEGRVWLRG